MNSSIYLEFTYEKGAQIGISETSSIFATSPGEELNLTKEELAFFDALIANDSAREAMQQKDILTIARKLAEEIRKSAQPDWAKRKNLRAKMRLKVKEILKRTGYPPDEQAEAVELVLEQAELVNP